MNFCNWNPNDSNKNDVMLLLSPRIVVRSHSNAEWKCVKLFSIIRRKSVFLLLLLLLWLQYGVITNDTYNRCEPAIMLWRRFGEFGGVQNAAKLMCVEHFKWEKIYLTKIEISVKSLLSRSRLTTSWHQKEF